MCLPQLCEQYKVDQLLETEKVSFFFKSGLQNNLFHQILFATFWYASYKVKRFSRAKQTMPVVCWIKAQEECGILKFNYIHAVPRITVYGRYQPREQLLIFQWL